MVRRQIRSVEKWVGEELVKAGMSKYNAARQRKSVIEDPRWKALSEKYTTKLYEAGREFNERYGYGMAGLRMNTKEYRKHLLKWNKKEVARFDRTSAKYTKLAEQFNKERLRLITQYAKAHIPKTKAKKATKKTTKRKRNPTVGRLVAQALR